jgi:hypothetical protein
MTGRRARLVIAMAMASLAMGLAIAAQMPDPRQMSGVPLPVGDMATGSVSVRLVRGSLDKPIVGQPVTLNGPSAPITSKTNEAGRVAFNGLTPGTRVRAVAVVGDERLESQEFPVPATGGVRLMLVATNADAERRGAEDPSLAQSPAQPGIVVLGEQTRFVFEFADDGLNAFNIIQILNTARTPVLPAQPIIFDMPAEGAGVALLDGSSPQASIQGKRIIVAGPFAPGMTLVQFAYSLPYTGDRLTVHQTMPVALSQLSVIAQKLGNMHLSSPQLAQHRDMQAEGRTFIVGQGPGVKAGEAVTFEFTGLPHEPVWPRNLALASALAIFAGGIWAAVRADRIHKTQDERRKKLEAKRERLFNELVALEEQRRSADGAGITANPAEETRYNHRRRELFSALERVYAEMDEEAAA